MKTTRRTRCNNRKAPRDTRRSVTALALSCLLALTVPFSGAGLALAADGQVSQLAAGPHGYCQASPAFAYRWGRLSKKA